MLGEWHAAGRIPADAARLTAPEESEEVEYAALMAAAETSAELLGGSGRRVVVVAEAAGEAGEVPMRRVVAGDADVEEFDEPDADLAWFATPEIEQLLAAL